MKKFSFIILLLVLIFPIRTQAEENMWVMVLNDGIKEPLIHASEVKCVWTWPSPSLVNQAGECGRNPNTKNVFMIYAHNTWVDKVMAHYDRKAGGIWAWGALEIGDPVQFFDGHKIWQGKVFEVIRNAGSLGIDGNTEFNCPGKICGTLTTCADIRPAYIVIRIVYK